MTMAAIGHNLPTPSEWLHAVLHSQRVTRIAQHLALVLFHVMDEKGAAQASVRDLERITGWGRQAIADHLGELEDFIDITLGTGRAKSRFELQCQITEALEMIRVHEADAKTNNLAVHQTDAKTDATVASALAASTADAKTVVSVQADAKLAPRARIESPSGIDSTLKFSLEQSRAGAEASAVDAPKIDLDDLSNRLTRVCNGALDNPVNCQGLLSMAIPLMWIREGCDLEFDIVPTLAAMAKKNHGKRLRSWQYFSAAIRDARDARLRGLGGAPPLPTKSGIVARGLSPEQQARVDAALKKGRTSQNA